MKRATGAEESNENWGTARMGGIARFFALREGVDRDRQNPQQTLTWERRQGDDRRAGQGEAKGLAHRAAARIVAMDGRLAARLVERAIDHRLMDGRRRAGGARSEGGGALGEQAQALQNQRQGRQTNDKSSPAFDRPYSRRPSHQSPLFRR